MVVKLFGCLTATGQVFPAMIYLCLLSAVLFINTTLAETVTKPFQHTNVHAGNKGPRVGKDSAGGDKRRQEGSLPTVYIIGVQKGGSSSLYELMQQHPQLCGGAHKENHFFDHPDNYEKGTQYFKTMFSDEKCNGIQGTHFLEGTPILHYPSVWQRIYDTYSDTPQIRDGLRFIVMLREPVARDYSWYEHMTRTGLLPPLNPLTMVLCACSSSAVILSYMLTYITRCRHLLRGEVP